VSLSVILVSVSAGFCGPFDFGVQGGSVFADDSLIDGWGVSSQIGLRGGLELDRCVHWPLRVELQTPFARGFEEAMGAVSVRRSTLGLPVLIGFAWPRDGLRLIALAGPELRIERVRTAIFDESESELFLRLALHGQVGLSYGLWGLEWSVRGFFRFDDPLSFGPVATVDWRI